VRMTGIAAARIGASIRQIALVTLETVALATINANRQLQILHAAPKRKLSTGTKTTGIKTTTLKGHLCELTGELLRS
jgi:hypothetical protein